MEDAVLFYKLGARVTNPGYFICLLLISALLGCNSAYRPIVVKNSGSGILVIDKIQFASGAADSKFVRDECKLPEILTSLIDKFADKHYAQILANINSGNLPADTQVLKIKIVDVMYRSGLAWSGDQSISLAGSLFKNGLVIGSFKARRYSEEGLFAGHKSTCSTIGRKLAKDVAKWLENPEKKALLGDYQ